MQKVIVSDMVKVSFITGYALLTAASLYAAKKLQHNNDPSAANTIAMLNTAAGLVTGVAQYVRGGIIYDEAITARGNCEHSYNEWVSRVAALLALALGALAIRYSSEPEMVIVTASLAAATGLVFSICGFFKHREGQWAVNGKLKKATIGGIVTIPRPNNLPSSNTNQIEGVSQMNLNSIQDGT